MRFCLVLSDNVFLQVISTVGHSLFLVSNVVGGCVRVCDLFLPFYSILKSNQHLRLGMRRTVGNIEAFTCRRIVK